MFFCVQLLSSPKGTMSAQWYALWVLGMQAFLCRPVATVSDDVACLTPVNPVTHDGCNALRNRSACLTSRDGRLIEVWRGIRLKDEPCVWCGGADCTDSGDAKCEPRDYFNGKGTAFGQFVSQGPFEIATCPGALSPEIECLRPLAAGCQVAQDRTTCLSSRDGRPRTYFGFTSVHIKDEPCVWCNGHVCTEPHGHKCEPRDFILRGEQYGAFSHGPVDGYDVASCSSTTMSATTPEVNHGSATVKMASSTTMHVPTSSGVATKPSTTTSPLTPETTVTSTQIPTLPPNMFTVPPNAVTSMMSSTWATFPPNAVTSIPTATVPFEASTVLPTVFATPAPPVSSTSTSPATSTGRGNTSDSGGAHGSGGVNGGGAGSGAGGDGTSGAVGSHRHSSSHIHLPMWAAFLVFGLAVLVCCLPYVLLVRVFRKRENMQKKKKQLTRSLRKESSDASDSSDSSDEP